ncbi:MAG: TonB-dependent receptor [Rhodocyclales bacterium]|nr:TonB-dependent receptor [Rhodocyclales bacterium]
MLLAIAAAHAGGLQTLETVVVTPRDDEGLIGEAGSASEGTVTAKQLENRPLLRPAEILEVVPGLIISQHSGDGKANQYYLRGFNLDHGTDFAASVMGMPANQPTHAHGQGYLDLHFLIPELVEHMHYRKGPYAAEAGDFATAGSASIDYVRKLDAPFAQLSIGQNSYRRGLLAGSPAAGSGNLLYAVEWTENNGPWQLPENIGKFNTLLRYSHGSEDNGWSLAAMAYRAQWASTDQVPQRALDAGLISRFGNLDASDGGRSSRHSLSGEWSARTPQRWARANAYFIDSKLNLWSNFTFCPNDLANSGNCNRGDQFEQADSRKIYGLNLAHTWYEKLTGLPADLTLGLQSRVDDIGKVGLYATTRRQRWGTVREDSVRESGIALYGQAQVQWLEKFRSIVGLRGDAYRFKVDSDTAANSGQVSDRIMSPKLALIFGPWAKTEYYVNAGYGFHSNDARGVTAKVNPDFRDAANFGTAVDTSTPLVRAKGYELGLRSALVPKLQTSLALWRLDLASELVFVGDAGTTEPSFPSRRVGIEWANYWTPARALTVDADLALSRARFTRIDATVPGSWIPGAIERTLSVGASWDSGGEWSGGMRLRYFGPRALIEDNSVRSKASTIVNLQAGYRFDRKIKLSLDVLNAFDSKVSDIDYLYESQLATEAVAVSDIHTHPAEPRTLRLTLRVGF